MKELIKGANAPVAASGLVQIRLLWRAAPGELDLACFALTAHERVPGDDWFVFYNQPASPKGAILLDPDRAAFLINLDSLPAAIRKCVFTATLSHGSFQAVVDATFITAPTMGDDAARFRLLEAADCRSVLIAEIYRYNEQWKVRAKGEGLKLDLAGLSRMFGVNVLDETPSVRPAPPPPVVLPPTPSPPPVRHSTQLPAVQQPPPHPPSAAPVPTPSPVPAHPAAPRSFYERYTPLIASVLGAFALITGNLLVSRCAPPPPIQPVVIVQPPTVATSPAIPQPVNPTKTAESPHGKSQSSR